MRDKIYLTLTPVCLPNKIPEVKININDFYMSVLLETTKTFELPVNKRQNMLVVEFTNKLGEDTVIENGKNIADLAVEIASLKYRTFDFKPYINNIATYKTYNGKTICDTHGYMSFSGLLSIPLESPLFVYAKNLILDKHFETK